MRKAVGRTLRLHPLVISLLLFLTGFLATHGTIYAFAEPHGKPLLVRSVLGDSATPTQQPTKTPVPTSTPTPTNTPTPSPTPTQIPPTATPTPSPTDAPTPTPTSKPDDIKKQDANDSEIWEQLAQCESGGNWSIDTGNGYYGGLQFSQGAWESVGGSGKPSDASREEQIERGKALQSARGWGVWGQCAKDLGLI